MAGGNAAAHAPSTGHQAGVPLESGRLTTSCSRVVPAQEGAVSWQLLSSATASTPRGTQSCALLVWSHGNKLMENCTLPRERRTWEQSFP